MFYNAAHFNQAIESWDVSAVRDMGGMFCGAESFNRPIGSWNVSRVRNMSYLFYNAVEFNQDIKSWDTSAVRDLNWMFYGAKSFNKPIGLWNVSGVETMKSMFAGATSFDQDLGLWDTSAVTNISYVFAGAQNFNKPLSTWNFSAVQDSTSPFDGSGVTRCVESRTFQALGWPALSFQAFDFDFEPCPLCPCHDPRLACVDGRCSPLNSGFIDLGRGNWMPAEALATAAGFRRCVEQCQESDECSSFILQDSGRCFLQRTRPQKSQDPDIGHSLAFLKPSCTTFSCGPGATPKPVGSSPVSVSEAACCSCLHPKVPEPGHRSRGDLLCVSCPEGSEARNETCRRCPAGRYAPAGAETCQACGPGRVANANRSGCQPCPPGTYSDLGRCATCSFPFFLKDNTCTLPCSE